MAALLLAAVMAVTPTAACHKTYTGPMITRAIDATYLGTKDVSKAESRRLRRYIRCGRTHVSAARMYRHWHKAIVTWKQRVYDLTHWRWPWSCISRYEAGGNPAENTGNGFYGGLQFTMSTWLAYGGYGNPADASVQEQETVAERVLAAQGWGAWPNTSRMCGL